MGLFQELKRRNVFKVTVGYIVMAWLVMQVADVVLNNIAAPDWVFKVIMLLLGLGLPFSIFFAWAFELTPEGLKLEKEVDRSQSITHQTGRKLDYAIIGVMAVALAYFIWESRFAAETPGVAGSKTTHVAATGVEKSHDYSIAVLPFVNMSSEPEQEYFSDGLSEELLNLLAKIPELQVASRSSAFQFKGEKIDLVEVAEKLKVAHVLEGSVRKSGNQIRITAQLIKADNGYHVWSETYDRSLDNIFELQDEISSAVVAALKIKLLGEAPKAEAVNPEAYALYLKGRYLHAKWGKENFENAILAYKQALEIDPSYAEAWASLSVTYLSATQNGYYDAGVGLALAREAVDKALELKPELATAWARLALIQSIFEWDWAGAERSIQKALNLAPDNELVLGAAGNIALGVGRADEALAYFQRLVADDPLDLVALYNVGDTLHRAGRLDEAETAFRRLLELNPEDWGSHTQLAIIMLRQGLFEEAWKELDMEVDPQQQEFGRILALHSKGRDEEAGQRLDAFIAENQSWAAFLIADMFAWSDKPDAAFDWLDRAYNQRNGLMSTILNDPLLTGLHGDPRWDELLDKMNLSD